MAVVDDFIAACGRGERDEIQAALVTGQQLNAVFTPAEVWQAFHAAVTNEHWEIVEWFGDQYSAGHVQHVEKEIVTPLTAACAGGVLSDVEALLMREEVQVLLSRREGQPPVLPMQAKSLVEDALKAAVTNHHLEVVRALVEAGVDVNQRAPVLGLAVGQDDIGIAEYLLSKGAAAKYETEDPLFASNMLRPAIMKENREMMKLLLRHGARHGWAEIAVERNDIALIRSLIEEGADPANVNKYGESVLHVAIRASNAELAKLLIEDGHDVLAVDKHQRTLLHATSDRACIKLLIERDIDINAQDQDGRTALHACCGGWKQPNDSRVHTSTHADRLLILEMLLEHGGNYDVNVPDKEGYRPLHLLLCDEMGDEKEWPREVLLLLDAGANVNAKTKKGISPVVELLRNRPRFNLRYGERKGRGREFLSVLRLLCSRGAIWDQRCEERLENLYSEQARYGEGHGEAMVDEDGEEIGQFDFIDELIELDDEIGACLGDRVCFQHWATEKTKGIELTKIEYEVYRRGEESIQVWLKDEESTPKSQRIARSKICVVGPSKWGKTSLIKSITLQQPSLVNQDDRTIGIDLFQFEFQEPASSGRDGTETRKHEVTFWDFAGQDVYHAAHAIFFSERTLYLLCVNLQLYLEVLSNPQKLSSWEHNLEMTRFVDNHVIRWVELIVARHPDAEFLVVGTKKDMVDDELAIRKMWTDLKSRVESLATRSPGAFDPRKLTRVFHKEWIVVSSVDQASVQLARKAIESSIISSERGFVMGDKYNRVLEWVVKQREQAAQEHGAETRVESLIQPTARLFGELCEIRELDYERAVEILRTFHDLGLIIWYQKKDHGSGALQNNVILDPHLVIDLVKEVISHKQVEESEPEAEVTLLPMSGEGLLPHKQLCTGKLWKQLKEDTELMLAFKLLLQYNELAYPAASGDMNWDSDLIVPAYWQIHSNAAETPAAANVVDESWRTSVTWKYEAPATLSSTVWRQFAVQSFSHGIERNISGSAITCVFTGADSWEARIVLQTEGSGRDVIRIVVRANSETTAWIGLRFYVMMMETVLDKYPGFRVGRHVVVGDTVTQKEECCKVSEIVKTLEDADMLGRDPEELRLTHPWLPPTDFSWFMESAWRHPGKLAEIKTRTFTREIFKRTEVLHKLVVLGGPARLVPALWTAEYDASAGVLHLSMLSDLTGKCHHPPLKITVPSSFFVKHAAVAKAGLWVCSTVIPDILTLGLVQKVAETARPHLYDNIQQAQTVHNLIDKLKLREPANSTFSSVVNGSTVLSPDATRQLLRDLLKLHDPMFDERQIPNLSDLQCAASKNGNYIWASSSEIKEMGDKLTPCEANYADVVAGLQRGMPVAPEYLKLHLVLDRVEGLSSWDSYKVSVSWSLVHSSNSTPLASETTEPCSKNGSSPSWASLSFELLGVTSVTKLRECRLCVYVKRPSRWMGILKVIGEGDVALGGIVPADADPTALTAQLKICLTTPPRRCVVFGRVTSCA